jgi:HK97 family phage major capsid protein
MADRYKDLLGEAKALFDGARAILEDKESPPEKKARVREMIADANAKKDEALALKSILDSGIDEAVSMATKDDAREKPGDKAASGTVGDPRKGKDGSFDNWGSFLFKVWEAGHPNVKGPPDSRLTFFKDEVPSGTEKKDMVESVGSSGGFLVPTEFQTQMLQFQATTSIVRPRATVIPMRRRQLELPVLDQTDTTAGQPHWFGGLRFYWEEEAAQKIESDVKFRRLILVVNKLIGYTRASDELVDDSAVSLDAFLNGPLGFAGGAAWMEDFAFLRGTGVGQPMGVLPSPANILVPRATVGAIGYVDVLNMLTKFLPSGRGMWVASQGVIPQLAQMTGPSNSPMLIWTNNQAQTALPAILMGLPIAFTEKASPMGTTGDLMLVDFSYYVIGDRQSATVESTKFDRWQYDQTSWRMVHRVDGQPWLNAPLTYQDGTTQVSPFVTLTDHV